MESKKNIYVANSKLIDELIEENNKLNMMICREAFINYNRDQRTNGYDLRNFLKIGIITVIIGVGFYFISMFVH